MPTGTLKKWDKQRKFGFIKPDEDNARDIFIHISGFKSQGTPIVGERLKYRVVPDKKSGKFRAVNAMPVGSANTVKKPAPAAPQKPAPRVKARLPVTPAMLLVFALSVFCLGSATAFMAREQSILPLLAYVIASLLAFGLYALDKYRAIKNAWRIPENTLHIFELAGGWPGAFVAQRVIRHKTVKLSYQIVYWLIVAIHIGLWGQYWYAPAKSVLTLYF
jgi:uncharacterized membrane protein YsdA (DUF1294 family)/cold shock CspA family protein